MKLLALLMTLSILVMSFAACNKKPEPVEEPEPEPTEPEPTEPEEDYGEEEGDWEEEEEDWEEDWEEWEEDWDDWEEEWDDYEEEEEEPEIDLVQLATERAKPRVVKVGGENVPFILSPLDLGADRNGQKDCTEEINACLEAASSMGGGTVYLPAGYYRVETNEILIPSGVTLRGAWMDPDENDMNTTNRGTVLMAYQPHAAGESLDSEIAFITMRTAAVLRNISVWYPEQSATNPQMYPYTIKGSGHTVVMNVTLYNSYRGFYNSGCSSMLIRGFYGTVLNQGIFGAEAYDIPRIEKVRFDTKYWEQSGLPNSPKSAADRNYLENYTRQNVVGIKAGRQDWGYWYDIFANNVRYACMLVDGNDSIGKLVVKNSKVGIYIENISYPGLEVSYSDIDASQAGIYYITDGNETLSVSTTTFRNSDNAIRAVYPADYGISLNECKFENWQDYAVNADAGNLNISNSTFSAKKPTFKVGRKVAQAVLVGNSFAQTGALFTGSGWSESDSRIVRADSNTDIIRRADKYNYEFAPIRTAAATKIFDVADYGAKGGSIMSGSKILDANGTAVKDSTAAIQSALNAAKKAGGGIVYLRGEYYRIDGGLTVPTGVELRGSIDGAHYGNGTTNCTHLMVYGGKGKANGTPAVTLQPKSGINGLTFHYPEQGLSDIAVKTEEKVKAYPPAIRADKGTWVVSVCFNAVYQGIDAMTNACDGIVISDVTGCVMKNTITMGHGTNGGWVQNCHLNYSSWNGAYPISPNGDNSGNKIGESEEEGIIWMTRDAMLSDYATRNVTGIILGDCKNVKMNSNFNITICTQFKFIKDPYTGGSYVGNIWGFAFDACHEGIYCESGNAQVNFYESMGVFNQGYNKAQGGGYNVRTTKDFTGTIGVWNTDSWSANSRGIAYVEGGTVNYVHCFPWCVYNGQCFEGGELNVLGTCFVGNDHYRMPATDLAEHLGYSPREGRTVDEFLALDWVKAQGITADNFETSQMRVLDLFYHAGSKGKVVGTLVCKSHDLNIWIEDGANVVKQFNGFEASF